MQLNNLVDLNLMHRLLFFQSPLLLEGIPTPVQVSDFLNTLSRHSKPHALATRFFVSERDGSISIRHNPRPTLSNPTSYSIHLITTTEDYTRRCLSPFSQQWHQPIKIQDPDKIPEVLNLFDPLQRHLLTQSDPYLHQLYFFHQPNSPPIYIVQTAPRLRTTPEPAVGQLNIARWPDQSNHSRRPASESEITLWAVLTLIAADARYDTTRLAAIENAITAFSPPHHVVLTSTPYNMIPGYNLHRLLRSRHSHYMDGRARFPLIMGALTDNSLLRPSAEHAHVARSLMYPTSIAPLTGPPAPADVQVSIENWQTLIGVPLLTVCCSLVAFFYLFKLKAPSEGEDVVSISLTSFLYLLTPWGIFWTRVFTGGFNPLEVARWRRELPVDSLLDYVSEPAQKQKGQRVHAIMLPMCRAIYNGEGLSFAGGKYTGDKTFDREPFTVSELVSAGFEMSFAADGREVLIAPGTVRKYLRLEEIYEDGRGRFVEMSDANGLLGAENGRIERARGTWTRDVDEGCGDRDVTLV